MAKQPAAKKTTRISTAQRTAPKKVTKPSGSKTAAKRTTAAAKGQRNGRNAERVTKDVLAANEATLRAWKQIYAKRKEFGKVA